MTFWTKIDIAVDSFLIFFFRLSEVPIVGYFTGIAMLALLCALVGQLTVYVAMRFNLAHFSGQNREMVRMNNLSIYALLAKDKGSFKACNREANEAFGKYFFARIALGASSLWPVAMALGWLQARFGHVRFALPWHLPVIGDTVGYAASFIPMFILMHILLGKVKHHLPWNKAIKRQMEEINTMGEQMVSLSDFAGR